VGLVASGSGAGGGGRVGGIRDGKAWTAGPNDDPRQCQGRASDGDGDDDGGCDGWARAQHGQQRAFEQRRPKRSGLVWWWALENEFELVWHCAMRRET
jgi:hypothetical protein